VTKEKRSLNYWSSTLQEAIQHKDESTIKESLFELSVMMNRTLRTMTKIKDEHPPRGLKCFVRRDGEYFTATPCYGMHEPWWVVTIMSPSNADPQAMLDSDEWMPLEEVKL